MSGFRMRAAGAAFSQIEMLAEVIVLGFFFMNPRREQMQVFVISESPPTWLTPVSLSNLGTHSSHFQWLFNTKGHAVNFPKISQRFT